MKECFTIEKIYGKKLTKYAMSIKCNLQNKTQLHIKIHNFCLRIANLSDYDENLILIQLNVNMVRQTSQSSHSLFAQPIRCTKFGEVEQLKCFHCLLQSPKFQKTVHWPPDHNFWKRDYPFVKLITSPLEKCCGRLYVCRYLYESKHPISNI